MTRMADRLRRSLRAFRGEDAGFGLVEIMVSITLLALLSIMFLPLLIQGLRISAWNTTLATANQLVNQKLNEAQSKSPSCANLINSYDTEAEALTSVDDPRGVKIWVRVTTDPAISVADCPDSTTDDLFVSVLVEAWRDDEDYRLLVSAESLVFVEPVP